MLLVASYIGVSGIIMILAITSDLDDKWLPESLNNDIILSFLFLFWPITFTIIGIIALIGQGIKIGRKLIKR